MNSRESSDPYYDLFGDWDLIISSFLSQYGLRIRTKEFESVSWDEFKSLLAGMAPETALGRMVAIRSETDKDVIKHFTREQKRIHDDWRNHINPGGMRFRILLIGFFRSVSSGFFYSYFSGIKIQIIPG